MTQAMLKDAASVGDFDPAAHRFFTDRNLGGHMHTVPAATDRLDE
jgi:hypothetical protein